MPAKVASRLMPNRSLLASTEAVSSGTMGAMLSEAVPI
jgi:hypothetical protein